MVHPPSSCSSWNLCDARLTPWFVASTPSPDERVAMRIPVGRGGGDGGGDLVPGLEAAALEGQGPEHLPPGLDQVEIGRVGRLEDELPTRMGQREQEHIGGAVDVQVVDDGVDALDLRRIQASTWPRKSTQFTMVRPRYGAVNASPVAGRKAPKMYPFPRRP